jgi:acyl-CoA synthetase (AMP-forming)/AMP-acid ligase II
MRDRLAPSNEAGSSSPGRTGRTGRIRWELDVLWTNEAIALSRKATGLTLGRALRNRASIRPDAAAVDHPNGQISYAELDELSTQAAHALTGLGLSAGDLFAVLGENTVELCVLLYAAAKIGVAVAILNWRLRTEELAYCIELVESGAVLCSSAHRKTRALLRPSTRAGHRNPQHDHQMAGLNSRIGQERKNMYGEGSLT